jgi:hypothetical protein
MCMKLSDAQFGALWHLADHGPVTAEEIIGPRNMAGKRKTTLKIHSMTAATINRLEAGGLVTVERIAAPRPVNAVGTPGHKRNTLTITITDAGRKAIG